MAIENDDQMIFVSFMLLFGLILDYFHGLYWPFLAFSGLFWPFAYFFTVICHQQTLTHIFKAPKLMFFYYLKHPFAMTFNDFVWPLMAFYHLF